MTTKVGLRVHVVLSSNDEAVRFLGWGTCEGRFAPFPDDPDWLNPRIRLDSGEVVWGFECWWGEGSAEEFNKWVAGRKLIPVTRKDLLDEPPGSRGG
jgi:hypothetical protein